MIELNWLGRFVYLWVTHNMIECDDRRVSLIYIRCCSFLYICIKRLLLIFCSILEDYFNHHGKQLFFLLSTKSIECSVLCLLVIYWRIWLYWRGMCWWSSHTVYSTWWQMVSHLRTRMRLNTLTSVLLRLLFPHLTPTIIIIIISIINSSSHK